jgi:pimeloyl-ACP methyl ester carboxylesterase
MSTIFRTEAGGQAIMARYREQLAGWPVPAEQIMVPTAAGATFVLACGPVDAPPVVLLHGSGANAMVWMPVIERLSARRRVHLVDAIGEPGLSAPARPPLRAATYAAWLEEVLGGLGLDQIALVAESLGGWFALAFATRHPERVSRLALLNPAGVGRRKVGILVAAVVLGPFGDWGRRRTLARVARAPIRRDSRDPVVRAVLATFREFKPRMEPIPAFEEAELRRLRMPLLAVLGTRDVMFESAQTARRLRAIGPRVDVRALPGVGHVLPPQGDVLAAFLEEEGDG